ncbi:beta strand repeat-containing protein [Frondihabitans cladoniiphilus]|uniref:Repeat protein (TIGR01451 family) n=1 Tax=Frondihabitans cladoniiphilus TaxID=715785 RepID=A0ABP8W2Q9_9MICO
MVGSNSRGSSTGGSGTGNGKAARLKRRGFALLAVVTAAFVLGTTAIAAPASAAGNAALTVTKSVSQENLAPGDEFTYSILTSCSDNDCVDATLSDPLPAQFAGFPILQTRITTTYPSTRAFTGSCATTKTVSSDCVFGVTFGESLPGGGIGIKAGDSYTATITLQVPASLPATWPYNGSTIPNVATASSPTAVRDASDEADVVVTVPTIVGTTLGKTWAPASQQFSPGASSTITLTPANTSNVPATSLVVQDPTTAAAGATTLDASNPFTVTDFAGFGTPVLPAGATTVQVDAYVLTGGSYQWVPGQPRAPGAIALPDGVTPTQVAGLRFTFGTTIDPNGAAGSVPITVEQRATQRVATGTGASLVGGASLTNAAQSTVTTAGGSKSAAATAPYAITPLSAAVAANKTITPGTIPAGTTAAASITGTNQSNGPLDTLTLADRDYFTADLLFGGFSAALTYPSGATAASVVWHFSTGPDITVPFASGSTPAAPTPPAGAYLTGFDLTYTGAIASGAAATAPYSIAPTVGIVAAQNSVSTTNTLTVSGSNASGPATPATATAPLQIVTPQLSVKLAKTLSPGANNPVAPGGTVVAQLKATTDSGTAFVDPSTIVVTDGAGSNASFWGAFNPVSIASTQVPAGASLLIEYTTDGTNYRTLTQVPATDGGQVYRGPIDPALVGTITGLRYTFSNPDGFSAGTTVSPNTVFQARSTIRGTSTPTSVADAPASTYTNAAAVLATGTVAGRPPLTSTDTAQASAAIRTFSGVGQLLADKNWTTPTFSGDLATVDAQSGQQAGTSLGWGVNATGYGSVVVSDPNTAQGSPAQTTFQAFDLKAVAPVTYAADPLLQWDSVSTVELYQNGAWTTVAPPTGSWMSSRGFAGYTLSAGESAATTGVRITVVPNDAARAASTDPTAPVAGTGIAPSSTTRHFGLVWQLRNTVRVATNGATPWVTSTHGYNVSGSNNTVSNTDSVSATLLDGSSGGSRTASDTISIVDQPPGVRVTKTSTPTTVVVPQPGDVPQSGYPTSAFQVVASNTSTARASYVRVSDPMPCLATNTGACTSSATGWSTDPYAGQAYSATNPFERLNLTGIAFTLPAGQVDPNATIVTLQHYSGTGTATTTTQVTLAQARTLTAAALADVVGVSVLFQGTDPATNGGSIGTGAASRLTMTLSTQVRATLRSTPAVFTTPFTITNYTFAQTYDPVLAPTATPNSNANAPLALTQGALDVTASKAISPSSLLEANRFAPVTVTLGATQGPKATVPTSQVTITDSDQTFWSQFRLASFAPSDVTLPAGATRVQVDVQLNGSSTWTTGTPAATAALPAGTDLTQVSGIRFVFDRADQGLFSNTAPPTTFQASAVLHVVLLPAVRGTGAGTPADPGTPITFPSTITDQVQTLTHRYTDSGLYPDVAANASAGIFLDPGTFQLDVHKDPQDGIHTVTVGDPVPWTLTFTNKGTGYLTVTNLVDTLPTSLEWDGVAPTFADSNGGLLGTAGITTAYDPAGRTLTFTWPTASQRMAPGESMTITLGIALQPGLTASQRATNQVTVTTVQSLAACTNASTNGQGTLAGLADNQCGSSNFVQPSPGAALFTSKGVKGDVVDPLVTGATGPAGTTCLPDSQGFYKSPCAANTRVGGTDEWKLLASNSGTVPYTSLTLVDPLPVQNDRLLATGTARSSSFRPVFDEGFGMQFSAPAGTTITWQVTTDSNVCVGTSATTTTWASGDPTCTANTWTANTAFTGDWNTVTGLRAILDFSTTAARQLSPGAGVSAIYRTVDAPRTAADQSLVPTTLNYADAALPAGTASPFAWNQFGATAVPSQGTRTILGAPIKAGVTMSSGPLTISKALTGAAAVDAPTSFDANVVCTVAGASVDLGAFSTVTLDAADAYSVVVPGIPLGSSCSVTEAGGPGSYGEASRSVSNDSVRILSATPATTGAGDQAVTITNDYEYGQLTVDKTASTSTVQVGTGVPYDITVSNVGGLLARDFTVTDTIPAGATVDAIGQGGVLANGVVTWNVPVLAAGASATFTITLSYAGAGSFTNQAAVSDPTGLTPFRRSLVVDPCLTATTQACAPVTVTVAAPPGTPGGGAGGGSTGTGTGSGAGSGVSGSGGHSSLAAGVLAFTGSNPTGVVGIALALLLAGLALVIVRRRRRI